MNQIRASSVPNDDGETSQIQHIMLEINNLNLRTMWRDWSNLPRDLIEKIVTKLPTDFVQVNRFRGVCTSWRSTIPDPSPKLPLLMLSYHRTTAANRAFYYLSDDNVYWLDMSMARQGRICGSSHCWLLLVDEAVSVSLVNPVTKAQIHLPSLNDPNLWNDKMYKWFQTTRKWGIVKCVSSSPPDLHGGVDFSVMVIYANGAGLALCRPGDMGWTVVNALTGPCLPIWYDDAQYYEGNFYVVDGNGRIVVISNLASSQSSWQIKEAGLDGKNYLVESSGELLLVTRCKGEDDTTNLLRTLGFIVFIRNRDSGLWIEHKSLGDRTLFLGRNQSLSVVASDFSGVKANSIYFTTDNNAHSTSNAAADAHDVGIFNLEDNSIEPLPGYNFDQEFISEPAMWVATSSA